jgi:tetratricopeptide (TPR) repeat protein
MDRILRIIPVGIMAALVATAAAVGICQETLPVGPALPSGPALTAPEQPLARLPSIQNPEADSLREMPIAEAAPVSREKARAESSPKKAAASAPARAAADAAAERSWDMEQVAQQADRQTRHGFELAGRGAYFAARAEFLAAIRLVAEGLDTEQKTNVHSRALTAALTAIKEAEDFLPSGSRVEADGDLSSAIAAHATPVLKHASEPPTTLVALKRYLTFAQEQLALASEQEVAGSMALHGLGKLHAALAQKKVTSVAAPESKAVVFYQAALVVYPQNFMAANDLGVLLGQCGRYADARPMLELSTSLYPQSTSWQNLATVYRRLGQTALADRATGQADRFRQIEQGRQRSAGGANSPVLWLDPQSFAQTSTNVPNGSAITPTPGVRANGMPAEAIHVRPTDRAAATAARPSGGTNPAAPTTAGTAPTAPPAPALAPTPAAAQRMSWGANAN